MKRLFYIRHGETKMNAAGLLSGRTDTPLTVKRITQAIKLGKQIKTAPPTIDLIVCSPYSKTYDTAKHIATEIGYPVDKIVKSELFIERTFGKLEGTYTSDFFSTHKYKDFDKVEGAETIEQLDKRAAKALKYVNPLKDYDNVAIVGHGSFGRALRRVVNKLPHTHEYSNFQPIDNADIVELI